MIGLILIVASILGVGVIASCGLVYMVLAMVEEIVNDDD